MKCLIVTSRHGLLNWYPTFLLYAFSLSVLDLQFGFQLYFYNAVFHVVECGLEADQVSNFITRIHKEALLLANHAGQKVFNPSFGRFFGGGFDVDVLCVHSAFLWSGG